MRLRIDELNRAENLTELRLRGDLDVYSAPLLRERVRLLLDNGSPSMIAIDLDEVVYLDSTGLGVLLRSLRLVQDRACDLVLILNEARIRNVFEVTGLASIFGIYPSVEAAAAGVVDASLSTV